MEMSREDKLELAKKRLSKFQKKRKDKQSNSPPDSSADLHADGAAAEPDQAAVPTEPAEPSLDILPSPSSPYIVPSVVATSAELEAVAGDTVRSSADLFDEVPPTSFNPSPAIQKPQRQSRNMLEHVDYIERLNGLLTKENKSLADTIKRLKEELAMSNNEKTAVDRHNAATASQINALMNKIADYESQLSDSSRDLATIPALNEKILQLRADNSTIKQEKDSLQSRADAAEDLNKKLQDQAAVSAQQLNQALVSNDELKRQLEIAKNNPEIQQQIRDYQKVIESLRNKNQTQQAELDEMKENSGSIEDLESRNKALLDEKRKLEEAFEHERSIMGSKLDDFKKEMTAKISECERLRILNEEKSRQLDQLSNAIQKESKDRQALKDQSSKAIADLERCKKQLAALEANLADKDQQLGLLRQSSTESSGAMTQLSAANGKLESALKEIGELKSQNEALQRQHAKLSQEKADNDSELDRSRLELSSKDASLRVSQDEILRLKQEVHSKTAQLDDITSKCKELEQNLTETLKLKDNLNTTEDEKKNLISQLREVNQKFEDLEHLSQKLSQERESSFESARVLETKNTDLQTQLSQLQDISNHMQSKLDFLQLENDSLKRSYDEALAAGTSVSSEKEQEVSRLRAELADLSSKSLQIQNLAVAAEQKCSDMSQEVKKYQDLYFAQQEELKQLHAQLNDTSTLEVLQSSMEQIKAKLNETLSQLAIVRQENVVKNDRIELLEHEKSDLLLTLQKYTSLEQQYNDAMMKVEMLEHEYETKESFEIYYQYYSEAIEFLKSFDTTIEIDTQRFDSHNEIVLLAGVVVSKLKEQVSQDTQQKSEFDKILDNITSRYHEIQEKYAKLSIENSDTEKMVTQLKTQKGVLEEQLNVLKKSMKNEQEHKNQMEVRIMELEKNLKLSEQVKSTDVRHLDDLQKAVSKEKEKRLEVERQLSQFKNEHDSSKQAMARDKESAAASIDMLSTMLADEREQNSLLRDTISKLEQNTCDSSVESKLLDLQKENADLTQLLNSATDQLEDSIQNCLKLKEKYTTVEKEMTKIKLGQEAIEISIRKIARNINITEESLSVTQLLAALETWDQNPSSPSGLEKTMEDLQHSFADIVTESKEPPNYNAEGELQKKLHEANMKNQELAQQLQQSSAQLQAQIEALMKKNRTLSEEVDSIRLKAETVKVMVAEDTLASGVSQTQTDNTELHDSLFMKNSEIEQLRDRIEEFEVSLSHAEKTISTLMIEVERRQEQVDRLTTERDDLLTARRDARNEDLIENESPILEKQIESALFRAGETVDVIDELVRLAKNKSRPSITSDFEQSPQRNTRERLSGFTKEETSAMLETDKEEIQQLRSALHQATAISAYSETGDAGNATISLLQSHVRQLRKVWEHETNANNVLRKLLADVRERFTLTDTDHQRHTQMLQAEIESLSCQIEQSQAVSGDHLALQSENAILRSEISSIKDKCEYLEKENERIRRELQGMELSWRKEKNDLIDQLHAEKINMMSVRRESDMSQKVSDIKRLHVAELNDIKRKFRDEKQELLDRFRQKIGEFEKVHRAQVDAISRLKQERDALQGMVGDHQVFQRTDSTPEFFALQQEILALRSEQKRLYETLQRERREALQVQNHEKEQLLRSVHNLERSFSQSLDTSDLSAAYRKEQQKHQAHCKKLVGDILVLKMRCKREAGYRADLIYQKNYLLLLMGGLEACEKLALSLVQKMGVVTANSNSTPKAKFKKAINSVLFITRVKLLNRHWNKYILENTH